jgi:hypothetical protein
MREEEEEGKMYGVSGGWDAINKEVCYDRVAATSA